MSPLPTLPIPNTKTFASLFTSPADTVNQWANPQNLAIAFDNMNKQVKFDKVYLEVASGKSQVREETIDPIKKFFTDHGIQVSGATAPNGNSGYNGANSHGGSLSFSVQADRDYLKSVSEMIARHFDEVILDDWFFSASKAPEEIAAKGNKSWTQYRMEALDDAALNLIIKPAKAINPAIHIIIKYPNWYEHYQALGYDLDIEPKIFDAIYTGVETRDPTYWEQHLQQYESYNILRYLENVKPGGNDGGWVDTLLTQYIDRYPEQIWDMAFAKPKEITLWQWDDALKQINMGTRPWQDQSTSYNDAKVRATYPLPISPTADLSMTQPASQPAATNPRNQNRRPALPINDPRNGRVAGYALEQLDSILAQLGKPIGIPSYRPLHATGEEFYHEYLGMIGFPIDLHPSFVEDSTSPILLLTESAKSDPDIVSKIKKQLAAGKNVTITSGLLRALQGKGIEDITELEVTNLKVAVTDFMVRNGQVIPNAKSDTPILFPIIHVMTNQSWGQVNGFDDKSPANAYPLVIRDAYDKGFLNILVLPDNIADLYRIPTPALNAIRNEIMGSFPIHLVDAPSQVSLFAYDNNAFVLQSFLPTETIITLAVPGNPATIMDLLTHDTIAATSNAQGGANRGSRGRGPNTGTRFAITLPPHSYRAFSPQMP